MAEINLLHIYAQGHWHDDAFIIGNVKALEMLRDAINDAIGSGYGTTEQQGSPIYVNDGEGFETIVIRKDDSWESDFWRKLSLPYTDGLAADKTPDQILPWKLAEESTQV